MNKMILTAGAMALAATVMVKAGDVRAEDGMCDAAKSTWKTQEQLRQQLETRGWNVKNIKVEDGCFEAYALTKEGKRVEAYFNPATLEVVKVKDED